MIGDRASNVSNSNQINNLKVIYSSILDTIYNEINQKEKLTAQAYFLRGETITDLIDLSNRSQKVSDHSELNCKFVNALLSIQIKSKESIDIFINTLERNLSASKDLLDTAFVFITIVYEKNSEDTIREESVLICFMNFIF